MGTLALKWPGCLAAPEGAPESECLPLLPVSCLVSSERKTNTDRTRLRVHPWAAVFPAVVWLPPSSRPGQAWTPVVPTSQDRVWEN